MTGILQHRHPERSRGIFTVLQEISVYAPGKNDVLVLSHIRQWTFCNIDFSATLEMTTARSAVKIAAKPPPPFRISNF